MSVGQICNHDVLVLTPNDSLYTALQLFDAQGYDEIPVVETQEARWVVGMLKRRDAQALYNREMVKKGLKTSADTTHILSGK